MQIRKVLCGVMALTSASLGTLAAQGIATAAGHSLQYYYYHPCSIVTAAAVQDITGAAHYGVTSQQVPGITTVEKLCVYDAAKPTPIAAATPGDAFIQLIPAG